MTKLFNRWIILSILLVSSILGIFWRDLSGLAVDAVGDLVASEPTLDLLTDDDLLHIRAVRFDPETNNIRAVEVSDPRMLSVSARSAQLSVHLVSKAKGNDYPSLRVEFFSRAGEKTGQVELTKAEYEHGATLSDERVTLTVPIKPGDVRFQAVAFYPSEVRQP